MQKRGRASPSLQKDCVEWAGMKYRVSGLVPNKKEEKVYFAIRCYFRFECIEKSFETRGSDFMQAIEHRLYPVHQPLLNDLVDLELFSMFSTIWSVVGVPKQDFNKIRQLAHDMRLDMYQGAPELFTMCQERGFPMKDEGNLWTVTGDLKSCRLCSRE